MLNPAPDSDLLAQIPPRYAALIIEQYQTLGAGDALHPSYRIEKRGLPTPVWARRGLPDDGPRAWENLRQELRAAPPSPPLCIYIHVPFCASRCRFCDCYAFALRRRQEEHVRRYTEALVREIRLWAAQGSLSRRPVSTVHLGGGTPCILGADGLTRLVDSIRGSFAVSEQTEWALETTSSSLGEEALRTWQELGFSRLHVGVQSLQDETRRAIGRRESGAAVLDKLTRAVGLGWITSVDVIVGLPGQTPHGLLEDLERLTASGVEGFSVYELQHSARNHPFFVEQGLLPVPAGEHYLLFQLAFHDLLSRDFSANVFNHLARGRDRNLYFTYPRRGEDLLAIGAIADGVFGNYHYRHAEYLPYTRLVDENQAGILGGLRRSPAEDRQRRLETEIMSAHIDPAVFCAALGESSAAALLDRWERHALLTPDPTGRGLSLTPNGAWFAGQLQHEALLAARLTRGREPG